MTPCMCDACVAEREAEGEFIEPEPQETINLRSAYNRAMEEQMQRPTLRDQFAMAVLPPLIGPPFAVSDPTYADQTAKLAYIFADAMLTAREAKS